ncbi:helix-turn-helix domain-containing protein [Pseudoglutamicibacter cumminsii]|uniref:helix-turn-helix domain-containing protein n=1 Tax=Pseudoglutamicibacter cumminsii TaxID=156979 RepID=UPI00117A49CE|nr:MULTISPECIES: helix-turn-helix domain-containing protein [Pseudoglutamicibacter]
MAVSATVSPPVLYSLRALSEAGYGSVETLRRAIREGRLDAVRVGGRLKVTPEALARYIGEPVSNGGDPR